MRFTLALMLALLWVLARAPSAAADAPGGSWLDELLEPWQDHTGPGVVVAAARDGELLFERSAGAAHIELGIAITADSRFHAGSIAKTFTAYAILKLEAAGRLDLDDSLGRHLEGLPSAARKLTVRQLLQHTAGLKDEWTLASLAGWESSDVRTHAQARRMVMRQDGLNFEPGSRFSYSNSGYILLADVIESVTGRPYPDWLVSEVFAPLGLEETLVQTTPQQVIERLATPYELRRRGDGVRGDMHLERAPVQANIYGSGNLVTTAGDLLRWGAHLLTTGTEDASALARMGEPARLADGSASGYGFGLQVGSIGDARILHHGGALTGYRSHLLLVPESGLVVVVLGNVNSLRPGALATEVADRLENGAGNPLPEPANAEAAQPTEGLRTANLEEAARYRGRYLLENGRLLRVEAAEGRLFLIMGGSLQELEPTDAGHYLLGGDEIPVTFEGDNNGRMTRMALQLPDHRVHARRLERATVSGWDFRQYEGRYFSAALDTHYELVRSGDELVAQRARGVDLHFTPIGDDRFLEWEPGDLLLHFERNRRGRVTGFTLSTSRAQNIAFARE